MILRITIKHTIYEHKTWHGHDGHIGHPRLQGNESGKTINDQALKARLNSTRAIVNRYRSFPGRDKTIIMYSYLFTS